MPQTTYLSKTQEEIIKYLLKGEMDRLKWEVNEWERDTVARDEYDKEEFDNLKKCLYEVEKLWKKLTGI